MPVYASITFQIRIEDGLVPQWEREAAISRRLVPGSGREVVQSAGRGNNRITVTGIFTSQTDMNNMINRVGQGESSLTSFLGSSYGAILTSVSSVRRVYNQNIWLADLTFERIF